MKQLIPVFDELPFWAAPFGLSLLDRVHYKKNIKALDIGFGTGFPLTELAMRLGNSSQVTGIDPWTDAAERARKKIEFYGIENVTIIDGVAEQLPLPDSSIDLIVSNNGLNNVNNLSDALAECARVAKPGAQLVFTMNTNKTMIEFYSVLEVCLKSLMLNDVVDAMHRHIHSKRKPEDEITAELNLAGFSVREIHSSKFYYRFADASCMFRHYFIRLAFMDAWVSFLPQEKLERIFEEVESTLNKVSAAKGGFKLSVPFYTVDAVRN